MIFKNFTAVFAVNILCNENIISVRWNWMCLDTGTAGLGSGGWRSLFKYLYREEDKAWNCYENSSLHVSKDRLTVQGFTRTTPWRYLNNRLTLWGAVRGVCISKPKEKISFSSKSFRRHFLNPSCEEFLTLCQSFGNCISSQPQGELRFHGPSDVALLSWQTLSRSAMKTLSRSAMTVGIPLGFPSPRCNLDLSVLARAFTQPCPVEGAAELYQFPTALQCPCSGWSCTGCLINQQWWGALSLVLVITNMFCTPGASQQKTRQPNTSVQVAQHRKRHNASLSLCNMLALRFASKSFKATINLGILRLKEHVLE